MQFSYYVSTSDNPKRYDCASKHQATGARKPLQCLGNNTEEITVDVPHFKGGLDKHKRIIRSADDVWQYINYALPLVPKYNAAHLLLFSANVCPAPLITELSRELFRMCQFCGDNRFPYAGDYMDQLNIYVEAKNIIDTELMQLRSESMKEK